MSTLLVNNIKSYTGETVTISGSNILVTGNTTLGDQNGVDTLTVNGHITSSGNISASSLNIGGDATIDGNLSASSLNISGDATINGNLTFGNSTSDSVTFEAEISSSIIPDADNYWDLGSSGKEWKDLYIDGTAHIDTGSINLLVTQNVAGISVSSSLIPTTLLGVVTSSFNLGSPTAAWKELYISTASINFVEDNGTITKFTKQDVADLKAGKSIATDSKQVANKLDDTTYVRMDTAGRAYHYASAVPLIKLQTSSFSLGSTNVPMTLEGSSLVITGSTEISGSCTLSGDVNLDGEVTVTDLLTLLGNYGQTGSFSVSGSSSLDGDLNCDGQVTITDLLTLLDGFGASGSCEVSGGLEISGSGLVIDGGDGALIVTGSTELSGSCVVSGSFTVTDLLNVLGNYGQTGSFSVSGSTTLDGDLNCDGVVNVQDLLTLLAGFNASGSCTITGSVDCEGSINCTGTVVETFPNSIVVSGSRSLTLGTHAFRQIRIASGTYMDDINDPANFMQSHSAYAGGTGASNTLTLTLPSVDCGHAYNIVNTFWPGQGGTYMGTNGFGAQPTLVIKPSGSNKFVFGPGGVNMNAGDKLIYHSSSYYTEAAYGTGVNITSVLSGSAYVWVATQINGGWISGSSPLD